MPAIAMRKMRSLIRRIRNVFRSAERKASDEYQQRIASELAQFDDCANVHDLPQIFHYWSNKYLREQFLPFGITDPEQFYFLYVQKFHTRFPEQSLRIASIGCGNCDMEARLARRLLDAGITRFSVECLDINRTMLERGKTHAATLGVADQLTMVYADFNQWRPQGHYDVIVANQCLHHVLKLEDLFAVIGKALNPEGYFVTCDMIGRNGHQRWPEALALVQQFWQELPEAYRYNQILKRHEPEYINHNCATEGFEGIRAQDILPLLIQHFHFEFFCPYGNIMDVFIDRPFGHNFNEQAAWDRDFVDRLQARNQAGLLDGELKPTQMLAVLRTVPVTTALVDPRLTPEFCVRQPDALASTAPPPVAA